MAEASPEQPHVDVGWKQVHCEDCGKEYRCTPRDDYYGATHLDHVGIGRGGCCEDCLKAANALAGAPTITIGHPDA